MYPRDCIHDVLQGSCFWYEPSALTMRFCQSPLFMAWAAVWWIFS